jgi:hypothetical protein
LSLPALRRAAGKAPSGRRHAFDELPESIGTKEKLADAGACNLATFKIQIDLGNRSAQDLVKLREKGMDEKERLR